MGVASFGRARASVARAEEKRAVVIEPAPAGVTEVVTGKGEPALAVAVVPRGGESLVPEEPRPLSSASGLGGVRGLEGEWSARDAAIPYIAIGQRMSKFLEEHPDWLGSLVYDKAEKLGGVCTVIVTSMRKYYEEDTEFGSGEIPQRFDSMEEARESGLAIKDVVEADMFVLATTPEQYERCTLTDDDDTGYYPARMVFRSTGLSSFVGVLIRDLAGWLKGSLDTGFYELRAVKKTSPKGDYYVPVAKATGRKLPENLLRQVRLALGALTE